MAEFTFMTVFIVVRVFLSTARRVITSLTVCGRGLTCAGGQGTSPLDPRPRLVV